MKKEVLKWRLAEKPSVHGLQELVSSGIITKQEAREILLTLETEEDRDRKSLEAEIKFLKELVEKLSNRSQIVETIKYVEKPYYNWDWYKPYQVYCTTGNSSGLTLTTGTSQVANQALTSLASFSNIKSL